MVCRMINTNMAYRYVPYVTLAGRWRDIGDIPVGAREGGTSVLQQLNISYDRMAPLSLNLD